jgi:hypothetical protein|nr:MAG TPA: hypothetical protein [Caudoviricetes sp.]
MRENAMTRIKRKLLEGKEVDDSDFRFMELKVDLFKDIKFIKKRKAKRKCLKE